MLYNWAINKSVSFYDCDSLASCKLYGMFIKQIMCDLQYKEQICSNKIIQWNNAAVNKTA